MFLAIVPTGGSVAFMFAVCPGRSLRRFLWSCARLSIASQNVSLPETLCRGLVKDISLLPILASWTVKIRFVPVDDDENTNMC